MAAIDKSRLQACGVSNCIMPPAILFNLIDSNSFIWHKLIHSIYQDDIVVLFRTYLLCPYVETKTLFRFVSYYKKLTECLRFILSVSVFHSKKHDHKEHDGLTDLSDMTISYKIEALHRSFIAWRSSLYMSRWFTRLSLAAVVNYLRSTIFHVVRHR